MPAYTQVHSHPMTPPRRSKLFWLAKDNALPFDGIMRLTGKLSVYLQEADEYATNRIIRELDDPATMRHGYGGPALRERPKRSIALASPKVVERGVRSMVPPKQKEASTTAPNAFPPKRSKGLKAGLRSKELKPANKHLSPTQSAKSRKRSPERG